MRFIAKLVTERTLERGLQKFAPDQTSAEGVAREYLKGSGCVPGDSFEIYEMRPVLVATLRSSPDGSVERSEPLT